MNISDFDFDLPDALIAQEPPAERGQSRLLVLRRDTGALEHSHFDRLGEFLRAGDLLVLNNTRVFPARLLGHRVPSGGAVECLLIRSLPASTASSPPSDGNADGTTESQLWEALVHPGQKLKPGARVAFERDNLRLYGEIVGRHFYGRRTVRLWTDSGLSVGQAIDRIGHIPLPPYIRREDRPSDRDRYQTVFARASGSIAAPTAGLHFTQPLLDEVASRGIRRTELTLHVGYGTFKPVRTERVEDHVVDPEVFEIPEEAAQALTRARRDGQRVIAVGTTTARALESLSPSDDGTVGAVAGETQLFLQPGHQFRIVDGLITNFHLPRSSLLVLVSAFAGRERVLHAYREAMAKGYRFYSYGDAMLIM